MLGGEERRVSVGESGSEEIREEEGRRVSADKAGSDVGGSIGFGRIG